MPILKAYPNALYSLSEYYHFNAWGGRKEAMRARNQRKKQLLSLGWTDVPLNSCPMTLRVSA